MHELEPYHRWEYLYLAGEDPRSPFYRRERPEEGYHVLYDHLIHPDWDSLGSETLYAKVLFVDYVLRFGVIELMGEWNDALHNDVMWLKRELVDAMQAEGLCKFVLICENVLNFHGGEDAYYEEWAEELEEGWLVAMGCRDHVCEEWDRQGLRRFVHYGEEWTDGLWRTRHPLQLHWMISARLHPWLPVPERIPQLEGV